MVQPVSQGVRPPATAAPGAAPLRSFRGTGFGLQIPADWVDLTIHTLTRPVKDDFEHWFRIAVDFDVAVGTAAEYAEPRVRTMIEMAPGCRLLKQSEVRLDAGLPAARAEMRWYPHDDLRLYQRMLFVLWQGTGFTLSAQLSKKSRATLGPAIDRAMASFKPLDPKAPPAPRPPAPKGITRRRADRFTIDLPDGWADRTTFTLAEPDTGRFRRNLIVRRDPLDEAPASIADLARAEGELMASSVQGLEVLEQGETAVKDGRPAARLVMRRPAGEGRVEQTQVLAWRAACLFILSLTYEIAPSEPMRKTINSIAGSFAAETPERGA